MICNEAIGDVRELFLGVPGALVLSDDVGHDEGAVDSFLSDYSEQWRGSLRRLAHNKLNRNHAVESYLDAYFRIVECFKERM